MIIFHKKNTALSVPIPILNGSTPRLFATGLSPTFAAYYKDGTGSWTSLTVAASFTEIATTGVYDLSFTAAELNHDQVFVKYSSGGATSVDAQITINLSPNFATFVLGPVASSLNANNFIGDPTDLAIFKAAAKDFVLTILDSDGVAVDMSSKTLEFVVETRANPPVQSFAVSGGSIVVSGSDNNIVTVSVANTDSDKDATKYNWRLWDSVNNIVWLHGLFEIVDTSETST